MNSVVSKSKINLARIWKNRKQEHKKTTLENSFRTDAHVSHDVLKTISLGNTVYVLVIVSQDITVQQW